METYSLNANFSEKILLPSEALPPYSREGLSLITADGIRCKAHFLSTWNNYGGRYDDELDGLCHRQWACDFDLVRNIWLGRLEVVGDIWNYVELIKID